MKKVLSFVLVLALVLGSFSMAFAANLSDVAGDDNYDAINVVADLGIVTGYPDGTFQADNAVTRAEFAAMITRALAIPESALAGYTATEFNDVAGYAWAVPYLAFCDAKGIILGDGNGNVMPGRTINVNEAVTMILRAVGYTDNSAILVGNWPSNYVTLAQDLELYDDVAATATVDRGSAAQLIYNALILTKVQVDADGATAYVTGLPTMLEALGCAVGSTEVIDGRESALIDLDAYQGALVKTFTKDGKIVAIDEVKTTFLTGTYKNDVFKAAGVEYNLASTTAITTGGVSILNGHASASSATAGSMVADKEYTIAVTLSGKTVKEVYSIATWTIDAAKQVTADDLATIKNKTLLGKNFKLTEDKTIDTDSFVLVGADSLDKIAKDNVVYVYVGNGVITKIEVGTKTVEGKVTATSGSTTNYAINGTNYVVATTNGALNGLGLKAEGTGYLDINGDIYAWTDAVTVLDDYAIVVATDSAASWGTTSYAIKLFTTEGTTITPACNVTQSGLFGANTLVKYELDDKGAVKTLTTSGIEGLTNVAITAGGKLIGAKAVAEDVIVLINDTAKDGWRLGKVSELASTVTVGAVMNSANKIAIVVADGSQLDSAVDSDDSYGLIVKADEWTLDAKDNNIQVFDLLINGALKTGVKAHKDMADYTGSVTGAAVLQVITIDENGLVTAATDIAATTASISAVTVKAVDANIVTLSDNTSYQLAADVVVYAWNSDAKAWEVLAASQLVGKDNVYLYNVKADETKNPGYEIVIAY